MNNLKRTFNKNKKSIFSLLVAIVLMLTFNYAPISLVADKIKTSNAYKATSTQSYYSTSSNKSETNIGSANYPSALKEYFKDSNNSFNIETYYKTRFLDIYGEKIDLYLRNIPDNDYGKTFQDFLDYKNYVSIYEYYNSEMTYLNNQYDCSDFYGFIEKFVTTETDYDTTSSTPRRIGKLFTKQTLNENRTELYCAFANYINDPKDDDEIPSTINDKWDNVASDASDSDFYRDSYSYSRVKDIIDAIIVETVAIYSYDGATQNNIVGSIIANAAPTSSTYYYKDGSYVVEDIPTFTYETKTTSVSGTSVTHNMIYYFGTTSDISTNPVYTQLQTYFIVEKQSTLDANLFQYKKLTSDDLGYIDEQHPTYYKYTAVPFVKTNEKFDVYVVDENVTKEEKATYDSLFFTPISPDEIKNDKNGFFYYIPYSDNNQAYFQEIAGSSTFFDFDKFCDLFAPDYNNFNSILYLKFASNTTYNVYIDSMENIINNESVDAETFKATFPSYKYNVVDVTITDANRDEYFKITSSYSSYYKSNYTLYFKKVRVDYTELLTNESVYDGTYETKETPNIPYETTKVPSTSYEIDAKGRLIFALVNDGETFTHEKVKGTITQEILDDEANRNLYVEVPEFVYESFYGEAERTNKLYYKHKLKTTNKIYIVPGEKEEKPKEDEVYKNLYYTVITEAEYKEDISNYVAVPSTDPNYNANFKLYYRYNTTLEHKDIFVQNILSESNAVYVIDDSSMTSTKKSIYKSQMFIVIKTAEYNANKDFYFAIPEGDPRHSDTYKLYYKYNANTELKNVVYIYSTSTKETYPTFHSSSADYVASDYVLVQPTDTEYYVEGKNLYFKRNRTETYKNIEQNTYYYYNTSSAISLSANSYYMLSFYVNTTGENVEASLYITDKNKAIKDIALEHISTNKEWVKYVTYLTTDSITASSITLSMYMGDKKSILGSNYVADGSIKTITGSVLFDDINVYKINETDYNKKAFNDVALTDKEEQKDAVTGDVVCEVPVVITNNNAAFESQVFDNRDLTLTNGAYWQEMFNFDNGTLIDDIRDIPAVTDKTNGYTEYDDNILWHYYIGRDISSQGNNDKLTQYIDAYKNNELFASVISEEAIDKTPINVEEKEEEEKEEDKKEENKKEEEKEDATDIKSVTSTFNNNNMVLKLQNKNRLLSLGIASNTFVVKQQQYYKVTVWVYTPDEQATATLMVTSVIDTASTPEYGSLQSVTGSVSANIAGYTKEPTNEYGWIPVSFFIEGNALHDQECSLVLMADKNKTIYFDNITIESVSSTTYNTASSDSDANTFVLSLTPTSAVVANGVTNGYFNLTTLESNYRNPSSVTPKKAKNWEIETTNSSSVIAGAVPTSKSYTDQAENFYTKYNNDGTITHIPYSNGFDETNSYNNVYGIYAPAKITAPIENAGSTEYNITNVYKIYSASMSLKASTSYDISFDFYKGYNFKGKMVANLYAGSVAAEKLIASFVIDANDLSSYQWHTYHFYVAAATTAVTGYIEIGVENATGTSFFKDVYCKTITEKLDDIRDNALADNENNSSTSTTIGDKTSLTNLRFVDFNDSNFSIIENEPNEETNLHKPLDYTIDTAGKVGYSVGKGGSAIASYFDSEVVKTYSVTINKVTYYIGKVTDPDTNEESYKLYKYSDLTEEVTEIDNKPVTVESFKKVIVGEGSAATENKTTESKKTNYTYYFTNTKLNEYVLNDVIIPTSELTNTYSENVLLLANSYSTDYSLATAKYTYTLSTSAYYVLRVYVKTSDFESDDIGLNIKINALATNWDNINTTKLDDSKLDENGFACYQALITTNTSSITNLSVTYSIGSTTVTGKGYAIIAGATLEKYATEDEFNHYVDTLEEDDSTIKKFFGTVKADAVEDDTKVEDEDSLSWVTFFYVFSSLLLGITLIMAIVAVIIKKHPIKLSKKYENEHNRDADVLQVTKKSKQEKVSNDNNEFDDKGKGGII